jgi:hypothetical protein
LSRLNQLDPFFNITQNKITMNGFANGFRMPFMTEMFLTIQKNISNLATNNYLNLPTNPCQLDEMMIFIDIEKIAKSRKTNKDHKIRMHKEICQSLDQKELLLVRNQSLPDYNDFTLGFPKKTCYIPPFDAEFSNFYRLAVSADLRQFSQLSCVVAINRHIAATMHIHRDHPFNLFLSKKRDSLPPMPSPKFFIKDDEYEGVMERVFDDSLHRILYR